MKILVVEDEADLSNSIGNYLFGEDYIVETAGSYFQAEDKLAVHTYDLVLLDITLPDGNGLELIQKLKKTQSKTGILIISAKNSLDDKLRGLDLGADDYITKPFHLAELNSRIKAVHRRRAFGGQSQIKVGEMLLDLDAREVKLEGTKLDLTKKEYQLLLFFITNKNRVLTKESIAEHLWGDHIEIADNFDFVYTHVKNLRRKIKLEDGRDPINTVYGVGYKCVLS